MKNVNLFGERVLVAPVEEQLSGTLIAPQTQQRQYELGRIVAVGDGKAGKEIRKIHLSVDQIVWFQVNSFMVQSNATAIDGKVYMCIHQNDVLATLSAPVVKIENFSIAGKWCLLKSDVHVGDSKIVRPETAAVDPATMHFHVFQAGPAVTEVKVSDRVIPDFKTLQKVEIGTKEFFYIHESHLFGVIS